MEPFARIWGLTLLEMPEEIVVDLAPLPPLPIEDPDRELLQAVAAGDARALDELYARHGTQILAYLIGQLGDRQLAEEVLQDVMLAAWKGARNFRGESRVRTWLLAIARHRAINARRRRVLPSAPLHEQTGAQLSGPSEIAERNDERAAVQLALRLLPADQRETLELVFFHGLSGPETAEVLGVAVGTVKSRLHRAKAALRDLLRGAQEEVNNNA